MECDTMANKSYNKELFHSVMNDVDDRIHITRAKDHSSDKIIIREVEDESTSDSTSQISNVSFIPSSRYEYVENSSGQKIKLRKSKAAEKPVSEEIPAKLESAHFLLEISEDHLSAHLMVQKRLENPYTKEEILEFLNGNGIVYGIDESVLSNILNGSCYYEEVLIAKGIAPINGKDGYYEYHFNTNPETKPIILKDGSVDYNTLGKFELTMKDQLLATYHASCPHKDGMDIYGRTLKAIEGKELPKLAGKGFDYEPENQEYYANIEGKVSLENGELHVVPVFTVENLEATTGDLVFHGDVLVKGNVFSNVTVKTTGNITVNGHVEIATLIAGKDVLLKNGMQGSGSGRIYARGNVMAKFLEQTTVQANGNVSANAILNCNIFSGKSVIVSGTRGSILGGSVTAVEEIQASTIGNRVGIDTKLVIGIEEDFKTAMEKLDANIEECNDTYRRIERDLERVNFRLEQQSSSSLLAERKELLEQKKKYQLNLDRLIAKRENMADIRERSSRGKIIISGMVHPCSHIIMNGLSEVLSTERRNVTFSRALREIRIISNTL